MNETDTLGRIVIRPERAADHPAVHHVVAAAFESEAEAELVHAIRASDEYIPELALVAVLDGGVVGHVMISGAMLHSGGDERSIVMLAPIAVAPAHQNHGIGGALVRAAVAAAQERGEPLVVLEGSPGYYSRLGFEPAARYGIEMPLPDWAPPEAAQVYRLPGFTDALHGRVVYPEAFDNLD